MRLPQPMPTGGDKRTAVACTSFPASERACVTCPLSGDITHVCEGGGGEREARVERGGSHSALEWREATPLQRAEETPRHTQPVVPCRTPVSRQQGSSTATAAKRPATPAQSVTTSPPTRCPHHPTTARTAPPRRSVTSLSHLTAPSRHVPPLPGGGGASMGAHVAGGTSGE